MNPTRFAVANPQFTVLVFVCLCALGWNSFVRIPRSEDPQLDVPASQVIVVLPGANAVELERLVARPLEDALQELDDVEEVTASISDGVAVVAVEFTYGTDTDAKYDDVLRQVNVVRPELPDTIVSVEVRRVQTTNVATMQMALVSQDAGYARLQDLAEELRKRLEAVPGIRDAEKWAYPLKQVRVTLDLDRLAATGIPLDRVIGAIQGDAASVPAGGAEAGARRFSVKTTGAYDTLDDVADTLLGGDVRAPVRLRDVAEVGWTTEDLEVFGRFNGERAVFVTTRMRSGANVLAVRDGLRAAVERFRGELPGDVRLELAFDQALNVERRLGGLYHDFAIAIALVLVTLLPLGLRAAGLVALSVPLSVAMGLTVLYLTGFGLEQLSIVGLVIALGLLVDDSIVVVENIARFRRQGVPPTEAALRATGQIAVAVVGTTATVIFSFVPILMLPGGAGQFIRSLPLAVIYTVLASMVVSLTIIPFLASRVLTGSEDPEGNVFLRGLQRAIHATYRPLLHLCMRRRAATLAVAAGLVAASLALVPAIGFSLFPKAGTPQFLVRIDAAEGTSIAATDALAREVERIVAETPGVAWWFTTVGRGNPQVYYNEIPVQRRANVAELFVSLEEDAVPRATSLLDGLRGRLAALPGAQVVVKEFQNGPPIEAPIAVRVIGPDLAVLERAAARLEAILLATEGTENVDNPLRTPRTDLRVRVDRAAAAAAGVAEAQIDRMVRLGFAGLEVARFREEDGDEYAIQLALERGPRAGLDAWERIQVPTTQGTWVRASQVAHLEFESGPAVIQRFERERSVTVRSWVRTGYNTDRLTAQVAARLGELELPSGYRWELGGEAESRAESFGGFDTAILVAVFGVLAVIVLEFRSFRGTLVVASVIPLGVVGGLAALWLTGYTLSFTATIGFIALVGIEIKNSILLVDFTNQLRADGVPLDEAIERAGEIRFLPVVLTTATALGALLPLALARSEFYSPLAVVIMGGLVSSLLLSRVVTPVLYSLLPPARG